MRQTKSYKLETLLEQRILMGDYTLIDFPSERKLAAAYHVTQMTVRKALAGLIDRKLLERRENGSIGINPVNLGQKGTLVFLVPNYPSHHFFWCQKMLEKEAQSQGWQLRTVLYTHWDDAIIEESLNRFDGIFIYPVTEPMPAHCLELLRNSSAPVMSFGGDLSECGIPSLLTEPGNAIATLITYLKSLQHRQIDFLITQPHSTVLDKYVDQWRSALKANQCRGELFRQSVEPYGNSFSRAAEYIESMIKSGQFHSSCLLCATVAEATGACRALASNGIVPGKDVSVCAVSNGDGTLARIFIPSITSVNLNTDGEKLRQCLNWMARRHDNWSGALLQWGDSADLFVGESVCPCGRAKS